MTLKNTIISKPHTAETAPEGQIDCDTIIQRTHKNTKNIRQRLELSVKRDRNEQHRTGYVATVVPVVVPGQ